MFRPVTARFLHNRPRMGETYIRDAYIERLKSVTREALIANAYFLPNPPLAEAIKTAAGLPGVTLNIITNSPETNDLKELSYASRHMYKGLIDAGSHVFEWRGDKHGQGTIHAKFAVFDRTSAIIGSYNLDPRSEQLNSETVLAFESPELAGQLADQYLASDLANSEAVDAPTAQTYFENKEWGVIQAETFLSLKFKGML
jgi:phosphatidylserine/phosphatidylglycerophosphate/cardiolipin synthase-like enzyme